MALSLPSLLFLAVYGIAGAYIAIRLIRTAKPESGVPYRFPFRRAHFREEGQKWFTWYLAIVVGSPIVIVLIFVWEAWLNT